ncbi:MAG: hypothetical protein WCI11_18945 [Candidatus Methylumidiphilus sp.]
MFGIGAFLFLAWPKEFLKGISLYVLLVVATFGGGFLGAKLAALIFGTPNILNIIGAVIGFVAGWKLTFFVADWRA